MAKRRTLKREVNGLCVELMAEAMAKGLLIARDKATDSEGDGGEDRTKAALLGELLGEVLEMREAFLSQVNHPEAGVAPGKFYRALVADLTKRAEAIASRLESI